MDKRIMPVVLFLVLSLGLCKDRDNRETRALKMTKIGKESYVQNPSIPQTPPQYIDPIEVLSIGDEQRDNERPVRPAGLAVDAEGNIYYLDYKLCHVKVFDKEGKHVRNIAGEGQGPGELLRADDIKLDDMNNIIHVLDWKNNKICRYSFDGLFEAETKLGTGMADSFFLASGGAYYVVNGHSSIDGKRQEILKYNFAGDLELRSKSFIRTKVGEKKVGNWYLSGSTPFDPVGHFACDDDGTIYYGFSDRYEFRLFNSRFEVVRVIRKHDPTLLEIPKEEKDKFLNRLKERQKRTGRKYYTLFLKTRSLPHYYPVFTHVWLGDNSRLMVRVPSLDGKLHIDVFNRMGVYTEKLIINNPPDGISLKNYMSYFIFRGDFLYCLVKDREGEYFIKKYRLGKRGGTK